VESAAGKHLWKPTAGLRVGAAPILSRPVPDLDGDVFGAVGQNEIGDRKRETPPAAQQRPLCDQDANRSYVGIWIGVAIWTLTGV
jgi:hypothetical protein